MNLLNESTLTITPEFALAASLLSIGYTLECLDRSDPSRVQFCFLREKRIDDVIEQYWKRTLMVNVIVFYAALMNLKARLRNEK